MATIQARKSRGKKYWYIVESRRINGKPRPITLAYLGRADDLLKRLNGLTKNIKLKSYEHGAVAAFLQAADGLDICKVINAHANSNKNKHAKKPTRNNLTAGASILLAAIGRTCRPTSKAGWYDWAKTTSLPYLLRTSLAKLDSQHFWDMMDVIPEDKIENIEKDLLQEVFKQYTITTDTLFYDTTNFFTYIHTTNTNCDLAKRGRNKQKRSDLKQVGLALVISQKEKIPLFHLTYEGNKHDSKIFASFINKLTTRLKQLNLPQEKHTLVFDRGNNSKTNFSLLANNDLHYVAALIPYQHREITSKALSYFHKQENNKIYRSRETVWGETRTVIAFISDKLKVGQQAWIHDKIANIESKLKVLQTSISKRKRAKEAIEKNIINIIDKYEKYITYTITESSDKKLAFDFTINTAELAAYEDNCGLRILITNRDDWSTEDIIDAFHGQSHIERSFRDLKDPYNLAVRPQYHWTNQKIKVHFFICVLSYLLATILKLKSKQEMPLPSLIQLLNGIRLCTLLEDTKTTGKMKAHHTLEEMSSNEKDLLSSLGLEDYHLKPTKLDGFSVYN